MGLPVPTARKTVPRIERRVKSITKKNAAGTDPALLDLRKIVMVEGRGRGLMEQYFGKNN
jgi:hypothetical protein